MMPSSPQPDEQRSSLRRWGPLAIIVVIVVIVGIVVVASRGGDDNDNTAASASGSTSSASSTGAISFSQAKQQGRTDLTFPKTCDTSTGTVAIPNAFAQECFADQKATTEPNTKGVTDDSINVVVYLAPEQDDILDFITAAIANDDSPQDVGDTYAGYNEIFQNYYQTYGRKVNLQFLNASGSSLDAVAARADAVKAAEDMDAFAVWGGPVLTRAWTDELKARGVACFGCFGINEPAPSVFGVAPSSEQSRTHLTEYISKRLADKPAEFAGDATTQAETRKFGHLYIDTGGAEKDNAEDLKAKMSAEGVSLDPQISYTLDPARLAEQATTVISQFKSAGVTSVIFQGDPVAPASFTAAASAQDYHPEWIIGPSALVDTTAFGRTYDQEQWSRAFGISQLTARITPQLGDAWNLYQWYHGTPPPAVDTNAVLYPQPALFYAALQGAGPNLNLDTLRAGLFAGNPRSGNVTTQTISYGDHGYWPADLGPDYNGIDDYTEIWWNPTATGPDEIRKEGTGMYSYSEGGKRFLPGTWTTETKAFDPNGAVTIYTTRPPGEVPKEYPSPAGSSGNGSSSSSSSGS